MATLVFMMISISSRFGSILLVYTVLSNLFMEANSIWIDDLCGCPLNIEVSPLVYAEVWVVWKQAALSLEIHIFC